MIAVLQYRPRRGARNANLNQIVPLVVNALKGGTKFLVLPEMVATGYRFPNAEVVRPMAESPRGATFKVLSPLAKEYRATIVCGYVEDSEGRLFNSAMVINPEGKLEANYRKRLLYIDDNTWASAGDLPYPVFQTPWGTATVGICMDLNDPRFLTHVRRCKADVVCLPMNWIDEGIDPRSYWALQLRGWNGIFVGANRYGSEDDVTFCGRSTILRAGVILAEGPPEGDGWWGWTPEAKPPAVEPAVVVPV
jgi:N-carbamoylputrescine amidase